jgi:RNA recognition motif-containing protein
MATKLFVGGISWDTTDANLSAFFAQAGQVVSASVITDRMTGRSKGFGFVEMASEEDAKNAIAKLNGQTLDGRAIAVSEARPQQPRENNFGGGSRGGFSRDNRGGSRGGFDRNSRGGSGGGRRSW